MNIKDLKVGQTVYRYEWLSHIKEYRIIELKITKIGREYIYTDDHRRWKKIKNSGCFTCSDFGYCLYLSPSDFERAKRKEELTKLVYRKITSMWDTDFTLEQIEQIAKIIGIETEMRNE